MNLIDLLIGFVWGIAIGIGIAESKIDEKCVYHKEEKPKTYSGLKILEDSRYG